MGTSSKAREILNELRYDFKKFTLSGFINYVSEEKGREIIAIPWSMPATLFGVWMSDGEEPKEYVFYRDNVPPIHQIHIQLHELSHILLGHPTLQINRKLVADVLERKASLPFADLPQLRSPKKSEYEIQAEMLASLIKERVIQSYRLDQLVNDLSSEEKLVSFLKTMGLS
jgi:hypothetical protein